MEKMIIDYEMFIAQNETKTYENVELLIKNKITVQGTLILHNCVVHCSRTNDLADNIGFAITINQTGKALFNHCTLEYFHEANDNRAFIIVSDSKGVPSLTFESCIFSKCRNLVSAHNSAKVLFKDCNGNAIQSPFCIVNNCRNITLDNCRFVSGSYDEVKLGDMQRRTMFWSANSGALYISQVLFEGFIGGVLKFSTGTYDIRMSAFFNSNDCLVFTNQNKNSRNNKINLYGTYFGECVNPFDIKNTDVTLNRCEFDKCYGRIGGSDGSGIKATTCIWRDGYNYMRAAELNGCLFENFDYKKARKLLLNSYKYEYLTENNVNKVFPGNKTMASENESALIVINDCSKMKNTHFKNVIISPKNMAIGYRSGKLSDSCTFDIYTYENE